VVIVGGGIAGLAAAYFLRDEPADVTVLEGSPQLGGKLTASEVAGIPVDAGAEALLRRRPEGTDLIKAVGLGDQLVLPGTTASAIWSRDALHPLPSRQFMGVPADLDGLAGSGVLSAGGLARAREDLELPATPRDGDVPVAAYVGARFGPELVDRLVDPLLGGVYAGRSEELSFEATLGPLAAAAAKYPSLAEAAASLIPALSPALPRPAVFTTLTGGLGALPAAVAVASGATIRTRATVRELSRTTDRWRLVLGSAADPEEIPADAVVLALPARPASRLLSGVPGASAAGSALAAIEYASMAIVTLAYPRSRFPATQGQARSGYLVPAVEGRAVKAVTFSTVKWPHLTQISGPDGPSDIDIIRCSIGRIGEEGILQRDDADLVALAVADLASETGAQGQPVDTRVTRWGGALPQYAVGHLDRVVTIHDAVAAQPGLAVCGAAYAGVGIPACIATADAAAQRVRAFFQENQKG
jgi:oxygen-dependent protoporphyrinogen oxidase